MEKRLKILLTNDDGMESHSTLKLAKLLRDKGHDVVVIAPMENMSGISGAMSLRKDLFVLKTEDNNYFITGTPCDCINLMISGSLIENNFDLVISGINKGENAGYTVYDSGTVAAARRAKIYGYKSVAVSYANYLSSPEELELCNEYLVRLLEKENYFLDQESNKFININIPYIPEGVTSGDELFEKLEVKETYVGKGIYAQIFKKVSEGHFKYDNDGALEVGSFREGCDHDTISKGIVSVTKIEI